MIGGKSLCRLPPGVREQITGDSRRVCWTKKSSRVPEAPGQGKHEQAHDSAAAYTAQALARDR